MANYIRSGEWHIVLIAIKRSDVTYPCCPGIYYPDVTIYGNTKNNKSFYFSNQINFSSYSSSCIILFV
jgi:hypothetical protein